MSSADRIYLKLEGLDWDEDEAIDAFAASLQGALVNRQDPDREFRSQERDENAGGK